MTRPFPWIRGQLLVLGLAVALLPPGGSAQQPTQAPALTVEQKQRLKERNEFYRMALQLQGQGKWAESLKAAEKMLAIEREVLGNLHPDVVDSLQLIASLQEQRGDLGSPQSASGG